MRPSDESPSATTPAKEQAVIAWPISVALCLFGGVGIAEGARPIDPRGTGDVVGGVVLFFLGFLLRCAVWKQANAKRLTLEQLATLAWGCICWMLAGLTPQLLCYPWISRPGALTTGEYVLAHFTGATAFLVAHMLGWAIRNPKTAMRVIGWGLVTVSGAGIAIWGVGAIFEALTVKALLVIIVVLLLVQGERRG